MTRLMTSSAIAIFAATAVSAATDISDVDMNNDSFVGFEELKMAYPELTEENFDQMDDNSDNRLSSDELLDTGAVFPTFTEIDFNAIDENNDERVSYVEFYDTKAQDIVARYYGGTVADIAAIDANGDNFADFDEMMGYYPEITAESLQLIDTNNDNRISSQELYDPKAQQIVSRY